jgi:hypothetical protein
MINNFHIVMFKKRYLIFALLQFCITGSYYCQSNDFPGQEADLILAKAGTQEITVDDFRNRYEFMPHLNYSTDNQGTVKKEFLYSLIAEKLWALYGLEKRFDTLDVFKSSLETLRRILIKDALYKAEVESKIKISSEEISDGLIKIGKLLSVSLLSSTDSSEIFQLANQLNEGADFDSLLMTRKEYKLQKPHLSITFGSLNEENIENILYNMKPGSISHPVKSETGWFIFKLNDETINQAIKPNSDHARNKVFSIIQDRKRRKAEEVYLDSLIGGRRMEADGKVFKSVYEILYSLLQKKYRNDMNDTVSGLSLSEKEIYSAIGSMSKEILNYPFIKFDDGNATSKDFLYYLYYQKVNFQRFSPDEIRNTLSRFVKQFIEDEMIIREGIKRGFGSSADIIKDVEMWKEYYLTKLAMESFYDSVTVGEKELTDYIKSKKAANDSLKDRNFYKSQIELKKLQNFLTKKTIGFAKKYHIIINEQLLSSLKISELNTFTYRLIGFGGRIAALPITIPMYEWYYKLQQEKLPAP